MAGTTSVNSYERFYSRLAAGEDLHLLNTTIVPPSAEDGAWEVQTMTDSIARRLAHAAIQHLDEGHPLGGHLYSHVGHEATAAVATMLLGTQIAVDRAPWNGSGIGLALQLKGRIPEGAILTREQMEEIGYGWRVIARSSREADLEGVLRGFVEKLPLVEKAQEDIYRCAHLHGLVYDGPSYAIEMKDALRLLAVPA